MKKKKEKPYDVRKAMSSGGYKPVILESVYPNGEVRILNAFKDENAAVKGQDPHWPREKLISHAVAMMSRWYETYGYNLPQLRVSA